MFQPGAKKKGGVAKKLRRCIVTILTGRLTVFLFHCTDIILCTELFVVQDDFYQSFFVVL